MKYENISYQVLQCAPLSVIPYKVIHFEMLLLLTFKQCLVDMLLGD